MRKTPGKRNIPGAIAGHLVAVRILTRCRLSGSRIAANGTDRGSDETERQRDEEQSYAPNPNIVGPDLAKYCPTNQALVRLKDPAILLPNLAASSAAAFN